MNKPSHTDEEFRQILQTLFQEKKKNKEKEDEVSRLRSELSQVRQKSSSTLDVSPYEEEIAKFKQLMQVYKKKYDEVVETAKPVEEVTALSQQLTKVKELLKEQADETARHKQRAEKLAALIIEKEKKISELQQFEQSFRKGHEQKHERDQALKDLEESRQHARQLERVITFLRERQEEAQLQAAQLQDELQNTHHTIVNLSEQLKTAQKQANEVEELYQKECVEKQDAVDEVVALQAQFEGLKRTIVHNNQELELRERHRSENEKLIQQLKAENEALQNRLQEKISGWNALEEEVAQLKKQLNQGSIALKDLEARYHTELSSLKQNMEQQEQQHGEKQRELGEKQRAHQQLMEEKRGLEQQLDVTKNQLEESENKLKVAQQHLAKKVKESSDLSGRSTEQETQIKDLQNSINQFRLKISEMQTALDTQLFQEKRLQEQLKEASKSIETTGAMWEEKYFKLSEKWQESELKLKELREIEKKYTQLQTLLATLGNHLGNVSIATTSNEPSKPFEIPTNDQEERTEPSKPFQNLFDMPKNSPRHKNNLFE